MTTAWTERSRRTALALAAAAVLVVGVLRQADQAAVAHLEYGIYLHLSGSCGLLVRCGVGWYGAVVGAWVHVVRTQRAVFFCLTWVGWLFGRRRLSLAFLIIFDDNEELNTRNTTTNYTYLEVLDS